MPARRLLLAIAITTAFAPSARGATGDGWIINYTGEVITSTVVAASVPIAGAYWGALPDCPTGIRWTVAFATPAPGTSPSLDDKPGGVTNGPCEISLMMGDLSTQPPSVTCNIVDHEIGHSLGRGHSDVPTPGDPLDVMNPHGNANPACLTLNPPDPPRPAVTTAFFPRNHKYQSDRVWCRRHVAKCAVKYPKLYRWAIVTHPHRGR